MPFCKQFDKVSKGIDVDICSFCNTWCSETCMKAIREQTSVNEIPEHEWMYQSSGASVQPRLCCAVLWNHRVTQRLFLEVSIHGQTRESYGKKWGWWWPDEWPYVKEEDLGTECWSLEPSVNPQPCLLSQFFYISTNGFPHVPLSTFSQLNVPFPNSTKSNRALRQNSHNTS